MARTYGSKDKKKRKPRSDRKHPYTKSGKLIKYKSKRDPTSPLKLRIMERSPMSKTGIRMWNVNLRSRIAKNVWRWQIRIDAPLEEINTLEKIQNSVLQWMGYVGTFKLHGYSHGKNKYGVKHVCLADFTIYQTSTGLKCKLQPTFRLSRYKWFFKD